MRRHITTGNQAPTGGKLVDAWPIAEKFKRMMALGVFMDPLLVHQFGKQRLLPELGTFIQELTDNFYNRYVHVDLFSQSLGEIPFSSHLMHLCLRESLQSTASLIAYDLTGSLELSEPTIRDAAARLAKFISEDGIDQLYTLYFTVAGHDLMQPLVYHKDVSESDFRQGLLHHPYAPEVLDIYLLIGLARGSFRFKQGARKRTIQLTRLGSQRYRGAHEALVSSGYIAQRVTLSYVYQFDTVENWDHMCEIVWPNANHLRDGLVHWLGIRLGAHVLEAGCGTGELTLQQAPVEHLLFRDRVFDACVGSAFLHFVDAKLVLSEMTRVVVPGGIVGVLQGLQFDLMKPFFLDWFQPIFDLARRRNAEKPHTYLPVHQDVVSWFEQAGLIDIEVREVQGVWLFDDPDVVVQHLFRGVSFFQTELMELPWDDRRSLITELIARGQDIRRRYSYSERLLIVPSVMVRGRRPMS